MEIFKPLLKNIIAESTASNGLFKRNLVKEYLQVVVLDYIYSRPNYSGLVFYGGSCLSQCFGLPRLSEDLDFVDEKTKINITEFAGEIESYFKKNTDLEVKAVAQKFRIYLKFSILHDLGLSKKGETDLLFLKIEIFSRFDFCTKYQTEIRPFFRFNRSILIKTFDLSTLMATKIRAVIYRKWEKTDKQGNATVRAKGRDYFDLMWYLERGVKPNLACIENADNLEELKNKLLDVISKADEKSIRLDLEAFIDDQEFVKKLSKEMKGILVREIIEKFRDERR